MRMPLFAAAGCLLLAISACSASAPTKIVVHVTLPPLVTLAPGATPTATGAATPTPTPTATATQTGTATASPTASGSALPGASASPSPTGPAGGCMGTADNKDFFVTAAGKLTFTVYCAVPKAGWWVDGGTYTQPNGGTLVVTNKGPGGAVFTISEGAFCTTSAGACSPHTSVLGTAHFGDLSGTLDATSTGFAIYVGAGTAHGYTATGTNMSQSAFVTMAAALIKVPKA